MAINQRDLLREIRTFPSLIKYLRDELNWPIHTDDFENLTFDYTADELGIDIQNAAKILKIKRLRPLSTNQPWGIFFVKFEPKRLPVVALRRILSRVVLKKRASAASAERAAWHTDDLLFVSNYGESEERRFSFAHFTQEGYKTDLPTLKVLGWDNLDTPLHLDHVAKYLTERLTWPDDEEDTEEWRKQWRSAFTLIHREVINTSKKLSIELAQLARDIRNRINAVLAIETQSGPIRKLMDAFKQSLVQDLEEDDFADMYAQTITYGFLSARVETPIGDSTENFAAAMPVTNPFLKELMETFLDIDGSKGKRLSLDFDELGVSEIVELLDTANMEAVVRDFGDRNPKEDPVFHFYELFLKEYDAKKRKQRGVFFTPLPVVSFIVRAVDELLRTEFNLKDGLADTTSWGEMAHRIEDLEIPEGISPDQVFVQILDPATGTGTFLVEVIELIHKTMTEKWQIEGYGTKMIGQLWNDYVPTYLLPRLHGYELMMAPYAIAHIKIGLKLYETGYRFESDTRARVYLTNALEPPQDFSGTLTFAIPALAHEAKAVNTVKSDKWFTVVIGNPPYAVNSKNKSEWITEMVQNQFYPRDQIREQNPKLLLDDYVKFMLFGQDKVTAACCGVMALITNHGYLDSPTFRQMRSCIQKSFEKLYFVNLHGNIKRHERCPDGSIDQNVFDIQQGVAICALLLKHPTKDNNYGQLWYADCWGNRKDKYDWLTQNNLCSVELTRLSPVKPFYLFVPSDQRAYEEYTRGIRLTDLMPDYSTGVKTHRDNFVFDIIEDELYKRINNFRDLRISDEEIVNKYNLRDTKDWKLGKRRESLAKYSDWEMCFTKCLYRPFDYRSYFHHADVVDRPRNEVMQHVAKGDNLVLLTCRQQAEIGFRHVFVTRLIPECCSVSLKTREATYAFPLWLNTEDDTLNFSARRVNFSHQLMEKLSDNLGPNHRLSYEDIIYYMYSLLHSPGYRSRYAEYLKIDFPYLPFTTRLELFRALVEKGDEIVSLHLMKSSKLNDYNTTFVGSGDFQVEKVSYSDESVWIDKAKTRGFRGVPKEVWTFHIGGYQVCEKWLKDRQAKGGKNPHPGRVLTSEDIEHYQKIVVISSETIRIMAEIEEVIETHGGWPGAFQA